VGCIADVWDGAIIWLVRECGLDAWRIFGRYLTDGSSIHRDMNATLFTPMLIARFSLMMG